MTLSEEQQFNEFQKVILYSIAWGNNFSLSAHYSKDYYRKIYSKIFNLNLKTVLRKIDKAYSFLETNGFIEYHPTRGDSTIQLTKKGLKKSFGLKDEMKEKFST